MFGKLYTVVNEEFAFFADLLSKRLTEEQIKHMIVGGTAIQFHLARFLTQKHDQDLENLFLGERVRVPDWLRGTHDIDVCTKLPKELEGKGPLEIGKYFQALTTRLAGEYMSPSGNNIIRFDQTRRGAKKPRYQVALDDVTDPNAIMWLNLSHKPSDSRGFQEHYDAFIARAEEVSFPYCDGFSPTARIISPKDLLAAKIAAFRPKDMMDIYNFADALIKQGELDPSGQDPHLERLLTGRKQKNYEIFKHGLAVDRGEVEPTHYRTR